MTTTNADVQDWITEQLITDHKEGFADTLAGLITVASIDAAQSSTEFGETLYHLSVVIEAEANANKLTATRQANKALLSDMMGNK